VADYTAAGLIEKVRRYAFLPDYDEGSDERLLALLNDAQLDYLQPLLESTREEFRTMNLEFPVLPDTLEYELPARSIAAGMMMLEAVDQQGNVWLMVELRPQDWPPVGLIQYPNGPFYVERNVIKFYVQPPQGTLRIRFPVRLSELVLTASASTYRTISTINFNTDTVTLSGAFTNSDGLCDLVASRPLFSVYAMDATFTGSGTSTLVFPDGLPADLAVGDYVCQPDTSPVCVAPLECHSLLAQYVAWVTLQAKGDSKAEALLQVTEQTKRRVLSLLEPRPSKPRPVINYAAPGFLRWTGYGTRGGVI